MVKSKTDVITNSSTEIYTYWNDDAPKMISSFIEEMIRVIAGKEIKADEYFDISLEPSERAWDKYAEDYADKKIDHSKYPEVPTEEDVRRYCLDPDTYLGDNWYGIDYPTWEGIQIKAKKPEYQDLANRLSSIAKGLFSEDAFRDG
jgi:hypothetical protein